MCRADAMHLSSFSDPLPLMQLAMMMAEATPSFLFERSIFSVGVVPLSSSIGSGWPSTLRTRQAKCSAGRWQAWKACRVEAEKRT